MSKIVRLAALGAALLGASASAATLVKVYGTHNARFNLSGTYLGAYRDHTPLEIRNVRAGAHKLYVKSLITDELILFQFDATGAPGEVHEFDAKFRPPPDDKNMKARRRTAVAGAAVLNETVGDGSTAGRVVIGAAAIANELTRSRKRDRQYDGARYGNTIEIKTQEGVDVNIDGRGAQAFSQADKKVWHNQTPGPHKVYIRSHVTKELKVFQFDFPAHPETETITIRPEFRPPAGETVNAQARRRTGVLGALVANELLNDGTGKKDVRKVGLGAALLNEVIGSKRGRRREVVRLDILRLPSDLAETIE